MISYAQNFEDVILERFFKDRNDGFFVDIGAAWPVNHSVTKHFYDKGWHGINVEPSKRFYADLCAERDRDINLNLVVSNDEGVVDFFELENTGLSSLVKANVEDANCNDNVFDSDGIKPPLNYIKVESRRLESILQDYARDIEIDFLKIDVEGAEDEVIKSNNWKIYRPKVLIVEATLPLSSVTYYEHWEKLLLDVSYSFVYFDGLNRFYLRNDLLGAKEHFSYPPCVFDQFTTYAEYAAQSSLHQLSEKLQLTEAKLKELQGFVDALFQSAYWRITKPFRAIFKINR